MLAFNSGKFTVCYEHTNANLNTDIKLYHIHIRYT